MPTKTKTTAKVLYDKINVLLDTVESELSFNYTGNRDAKEVDAQKTVFDKFTAEFQSIVAPPEAFKMWKDLSQSTQKKGNELAQANGFNQDTPEHVFYEAVEKSGDFTTEEKLHIAVVRRINMIANIAEMYAGIEQSKQFIEQAWQAIAEILPKLGK